MLLCVNRTCDIERGPWSEGTGSPGYKSKGLNELTNVYRPANATLKGTAAGGATNVMAWPRSYRYPNYWGLAGS